jgi:hypothetical protein
VRIRQANDLPRIAWIRENFLVTGEAGIENDFTTPARDRAGRAAIKYAPVFERENCGSMLDFRQCVLRTASFIIGLGGRERTEVIHGPIGKNGAAINELAGNRPKNSGIVGTDAMVAHDEITVLGNFHRAEVGDVAILRRDVRLGDQLPVHIEQAAADIHGFAGQADDSLDELFGAVQRIPEDNHVAAVNVLEAVDKFVDEDAFLVGKQRRHAGAFHLYGLIEEHDDDQRQADGDEQVTGPHADFVAEKVMGVGLGGRRVLWRRRRGQRGFLGVR